jgi:2,3,4,5-tetrahydropyridine-2,6-dicarboxylate N-succinyltransferase
VSTRVPDTLQELGRVAGVLAIVIPGTRKKKFPAGSYRIPCALIIGERSASTDRKTSLTEALREHAVSV